MGICCTIEKKRQNTKNKDNQNNPKNREIIKNRDSEKVIKEMGTIGITEEILIENNISTLISIKDISKAVTINQCKHCTIFLSPSKEQVNIKNCESLITVAASKNINISHIKNSGIYIYSTNPPKINNCENITLGMYFAQFSELPQQLKKLDINPWINSWSEYTVNNTNNLKIWTKDKKEEAFLKLRLAFEGCMLNTNSYQYIPFSYGNSITLNNDLYHALIIFKESHIEDENEIFKFFMYDELQLNYIKLIKTKVINPNIPEYDTLCKIISYSNDSAIRGLIHDNKYITTQMGEENEAVYKSKSNITCNVKDNSMIGGEAVDTSIKFLKKNDILISWMIYEQEDIMGNYLENFNIPYNIIISCDLNIESDKFIELLNKIFNVGIFK